MLIRICDYREAKPMAAQMKKERVSLSDKGVFIGAFLGDEIIGCVSFFVRNKSCRFKSDFVKKEYRSVKPSIYKDLCLRRQDLVDEEDIHSITAFCTDKSLGHYLNRGFTVQSYKNFIYFVKKTKNEVVQEF